MTREDLARRCEAATGPDRALDCAIRDTLRLPNDYSADWGARKHEIPAAYPYTASLDAALTLVPGEAFWRVGHDGAGPDPSAFRADVFQTPGTGLNVARSATPALALCAAALRAGGEG